MTKIVTVDQIKEILPTLDLLPAIEAGFVAYSAGEAVVPPVAELLLDQGEVHIKYGYLKGDDYYVIKIASGFYDNPKIGLSSSNGMMLLFSQETGEPVSILLDEGSLTDTRTAVAGAIAAKYLAPESVRRIGIVGTGIQGQLQLRYLQQIVDCRDVLVWDRNDDGFDHYLASMSQTDFEIETTRDTSDILHSCNLVVTCTPAAEPLLFAKDLRPGTHITAVGSDTPDKQELEASILGQADLVVADSISQCLERGEIHRAIQAGQIAVSALVELGQIVAGEMSGRTTDNQITIADLTGVAVQDIKIATAVYEAIP